MPLSPTTFSEGDRRRLHELLSTASDGRLDAAGSDALRQLLNDPDAQEYYVNFALLDACLDLAGMECAAAPRTPPGKHVPAEPRPASGRPAPLFPPRRSPRVLGFPRNSVSREKQKLRLSMALAVVLSLLFAGAVAGTGAVISAIFLHSRPAVERPIADDSPNGSHSGPPARHDGDRRQAADVAGADSDSKPEGDDGTEEDSDEGLPPPMATRRKVADPVARLARTIDCVWGRGEYVPEAGDDLAAGDKLRLRSGLAEVVFQGGARTILQGPGELEVRSRRAAYLERGKCVASVADARVKDFEIDTHGMNYRDMGTEFGVLVAPSGEQEVHVFQGKVQAERRERMRDEGSGMKDKGGSAAGHVHGSNPSSLIPHPSSLVLTAHQAIRVATPGAASTSVKPIELIPANTKEFVRALPPPTALDLVDIVAGGDGLSARRNREINPTNGRFGDEPGGRDNIAPGAGTVFRADHQYHRVPDSQLIDGVFVVQGGKGPVQLDSAGHCFAGFPHNDGSTANMIQAVGATPACPRAWFSAKQNNLPQLGGVDYSSIGHGVLAVRSNKGITFDLAAVRAAHPGYRLLSFAAAAGNPCRENTPRPGNFWVFVDGQVRFQRWNVPVNAGAIPIEVPLQPADHYLTLVATTTAAIGIWNGTMFGDPKLNVAAIESSPKGANQD